MIGSLITSQTRIKLLKKFFLNSETKAHLRGLESEFGESTNAIRIELNRLEQAGLLTSLPSGNKKIFQANLNHPLYIDIHNIILKETGIDHIINKVVHRIGSLLKVYLTGDLAKGKDVQILELVLVGDEIDREYLSRKIIQAEKLIGRKISCTILPARDIMEHLESLQPSEYLLIWNDGNGI